MKKITVSPFHIKLFQLIIFGCTLILLITFLGRALNPLYPEFFNFHDETQAGRIHDFTLNLSSGIIPPRLAPTFSFNLGFPVFNFYAPVAYWITSLMHLSGMTIIASLKLSFLLTILLSFTTMYLLLRNFFSFFSSLLGGVLYVTSSYFAVEIFVRGNLAETWFIVFFPLALSMLVKNSKQFSRLNFFFTCVVLSLLFTVHNIFSLLSVGVFIVFSLLLENKRRNSIAVIIGLLLGSYFLVPALLETKYTQAPELARLFKYQEHFLCPWQIWTSPIWYYSGSLPGCIEDGMSFKIGKIQVVLGAIGGILLLINTVLHRKNKEQLKKDLVYLFLLALTCFSLFLTTYQSEFIWKIFEPILSLFQFPWRLILFGMFGTAFFGAYLFDNIPIIPSKIMKFVQPVMVITLILVATYSVRNYFMKPMLDADLFNVRYISQDYLEEVIAYNVREYLPKNADYLYWHDLNPLEVNSKKKGFNHDLPIQTKSKYKVNSLTYFDKSIEILQPGKVNINIHDFPFWKIYVNGEQVKPTVFDKLMRPQIELKEPATLRIKYEESGIEKLGNIMTIISFILLVLYTIFTDQFALIGKRVKLMLKNYGK